LSILTFGRRRKPEWFDLAMEALGGTLAETEELYVAERALRSVAVERVVELEKQLERERHWHKVDVEHLRVLMDVDAESDD